MMHTVETCVMIVPDPWSLIYNLKAAEELQFVYFERHRNVS